MRPCRTVSRCASGDQPTTPPPPPSAPPWAPKRPESLQYTFEIGPRCEIPSRHASRIEAGELGVSWWWPPQWSSTNLQATIRSSVVIIGHQRPSVVMSGHQWSSVVEHENLQAIR